MAVSKREGKKEGKRGGIAEEMIVVVNMLISTVCSVHDFTLLFP